MFIKKFNTFILIILILFTKKLYAEKMLIDNFNNDNQDNWEFISDKVMGGVSFGNYEILNEDNLSFLRLTGFVSLENNGGFIQVRRKLEKLNLEGSKFIEIVAKGNNQNYFIHLRTSGTFLPWQYYQISFKVLNSFETFKLPISEFKRSSVFLSKRINPKNITSIGVVAFGRDHSADIYIKEINFTN